MALFTTKQGYKASTILASQNVMRVLILNSDGNVTIQTKNYPHPMDPDGVADEVRLYCSKCQASKQFEFSTLFSETKLIEELAWAMRHKHTDGQTVVILQDETSVPVIEAGRKLKVVQ